MELQGRNAAMKKERVGHDLLLASPKGPPPAIPCIDDTGDLPQRRQMKVPVGFYLRTAVDMPVVKLASQSVKQSEEVNEKTRGSLTECVAIAQWSSEADGVRRR